MGKKERVNHDFIATNPKRLFISASTTYFLEFYEGTETDKQTNTLSLLYNLMSALNIQSTLLISTSLISNNRLSRSEILVPVLHGNLRTGTKILWKRGEIGAISPLFHNIFNISLTSGVKLHIHLLNVAVRFIVFLISATLVFRGTDISKCFRVPWNSR